MNSSSLKTVRRLSITYGDKANGKGEISRTFRL